MLTKDQIAMAEEKCLEVVNTRKHHDFYHPVFARILGQYGAERTWRCATDLLLYKGDQWDRLMSSGVSSELCDVRNFISASQYNGVSQTTEFSRYVVALVLEHWLSSNAPKSQNQTPLHEATALIESAISRMQRIDSILTKETAMSLKIETKTFVNGAEIAKMNVEGLVTIIRQTEDEIRSLEALESKPKKVVNKIEELKAGLAKLVEHADAE